MNQTINPENIDPSDTSEAKTNKIDNDEKYYRSLSEVDPILPSRLQELFREVEKLDLMAFLSRNTTSLSQSRKVGFLRWLVVAVCQSMDFGPTLCGRRLFQTVVLMLR